MSKMDGLASSFLMEALQKNWFPCFSCFQRLPTSLSSYPHMPPTSAAIVQSPSLTLTLPSLSYKDPYDFIGPTKKVQDNLLISSSQDPSFIHICKIHIGRLQGLGCGPLWGAIIQSDSISYRIHCTLSTLSVCGKEKKVGNNFYTHFLTVSPSSHT